jgi:uncharacterized protein YcbX
MAHIAALVVYPVKGCRGVAMQRCAFTAAGLQWDRSWMVVNASGKFVTQVRSIAATDCAARCTPVPLHAVRCSLQRAALLTAPHTPFVRSGKRASSRLSCRRCRLRQS